ncbi:class I SAM-dependent methyltransferase [Mucilaginibacter sp. CSA2-8R]|uniref:class I SAM-dependent methyltransferase n=1 Tax=Mucilaginibacter sp. CSA2-8R TaxID=3141542 RepID=UPI00315D87E2
MSANYDNASWFYERLSKLVFGNAQVNAQEYFLKLIPTGSSILIIGGGTGQILESIAKLYPSELHITYVEISANMMALSRKRNTAENDVVYITQDIGSLSLTQKFDVIITAFLFDNFSTQELHKIFPRIHQCLKPEGLWLNTDFQLTGPIWQKAMLKTMYYFFRVLNAVKVTQLPDTTKTFINYRYELLGQKPFYRNFITANAYKKSRT